MLPTPSGSLPPCPMVSSTVMSLAEVDDVTLAEVAEACNVPAAQIEDIYACVPQQLDQLAERRSEVFQLVLSFGQAADIDRWCEAVRRVVSLNAVFRTRLVRCRLGIVQVATSEEHVTERRSGDVEQYLREEASAVRRLGLGTPLFRSAFVGRSFVATAHHAVMDYWSLSKFLNEDVARVYLGHPLTKRPAFKEFVARCMAVDEAAATAFWAFRFKGVPAIFPQVGLGFSPHPSAVMTRKICLKGIGNEICPSHVPWFAEAAWALTAGTYADSDSVAYGLVVSGRSAALNGIETTLGPTFVEVPVQVNLQRNMTVERLVKDRATSLRQLSSHPAFLQYGMPKISAASEAARTASAFQSLFNVVPPLAMALATTAAESKSVRLERIVWQARGGFGLMMFCSILDDGISVKARYDRAVLCERQLHRVLRQFEHTLQLLTAVPLQTRLDRLPRLNAHDRLEVLQWNKTVPDAVDKPVHELFRARARAQPEAVAVEASDGRASYAQMDQMSDRVARELRRRGVLPGSPVAFIFEKSLWAVVAVLGIMKAGGACVPVDKDSPRDRRAAVVSSAGSTAILTSSAQYSRSAGLAPDVFAVDAESVAGLPGAAGPLDDGTARTSSPDHLAYIAFTGGGIAGAPKGVMLEHRCLASSLVSLAQRLGWQPGCRMLQFAPHVSGSSICEMFGALLFGGCLCIPSEEEADLIGFVEAAQVNWAMLPPGVLRTMSASDVPGLQSLLSIGEPVDAEAVQTWGAALRFFNGWGACEASILSTVAELTPGARYPDSIGTPVGCAVWIASPQNAHELAPIGSVGELLVQGPGVAKGYLDDEAKTAACFIPPPPWASACSGSGTRCYRTGDLARYNADGSICFIGRQANRVKLGGQTAQLEAVESVIGSCGEVRDAVALTRIAAGRTQLVAVICLADPRLPGGAVLQELPGGYAEAVDEGLDAVRAYVRSRLPSARVPALWLVVGQLPRMASQKLDRAAVREWLRVLRR